MLGPKSLWWTLVLSATVLGVQAAADSPSESRCSRYSLQLAEGSDGLRWRALEYRDDLWYGSAYWGGPDWTRVGKNWHHPGEQTPSVRRFVVPADGRVTVSGPVRKAHLDGDGIRAWIEHRGRKIWQAELDGKDEKGRDPELKVDVRRGDSLRFVVHKRGAIFCDTTWWDPVVTYADGRRFQASAGFSRKQGDGGWSYEMEATASEEGLPRLRWLGRDLLFHQRTLAPGVDLTLTEADSLGLVVASDGSDQGGLALGVGSATAWRLSITMATDGVLQIALTRPVAQGKPESTDPLARLAYRGAWIEGWRALARATPDSNTAAWKARLDTAFSRLAPLRLAGARTAAASAVPYPSLDFWAMIQAEWQREDRLDAQPDDCAAACKRHLDRARQLMDDLCRGRPVEFLRAEREELEQLTRRPKASDAGAARALYVQTRWLKRRIALANPLLDFGPILFAKRVPTSYSHLVMQYFGWRARPGGGLCVLEQPGLSLECRDLLHGRLHGGSVLEPRLDWDGRRIAFSYVDLEGKSFEAQQVDNQSDEGFYHLYQVNMDGTGLRQLTSGPYDDLMPTWLPDGDIAFTSTRRRGYARCFGPQFSRRWHVYTLHRVDANGGPPWTLSFHDTNEWFPTISHSGMVVYARWDYIDRDAVTHQNLWTTRPDGTSPAALWGNATQTPHCSFQAQPIPGTEKYVVTAAPHHSISAGSIAVIDPTVGRDGPAAVTRITPEVPFPESESREIGEYFSSPWPLSEHYFLVSYSPHPLVWEPGANKANALGLYLLDAWGNRELLYRDPEIGCESACPIAPRPRPPVVASHRPPKAEPKGEMTLADVYQGLGPVPTGSIKQLRIVQIFPKATPVADNPPIGMAREENGRAILGTVPVEPDGSARFFVPARRPLLFQALLEDGSAYQTMRTVTYVQPGERVACIGCHERRMSTPPTASGPLSGTKGTRGDLLAARRPPSMIDPGPWGGRPFSFVEMVQPVLDRHCVRCHGGERTDGGVDLRGLTAGPFSRSYQTLCGDRDFWGGGTNAKNAFEALVPRFGGRNTIQVTAPGGAYGARGSRLLRLLQAGHFDVRLPPADRATLAAWIDLNAVFYGINLPQEQARQARGERVPMPELQ